MLKCYDTAWRVVLKFSAMALGVMACNAIKAIIARLAGGQPFPVKVLHFLFALSFHPASLIPICQLWKMGFIGRIHLFAILVGRGYYNEDGSFNS